MKASSRKSLKGLKIDACMVQKLAAAMGMEANLLF